MFCRGCRSVFPCIYAIIPSVHYLFRSILDADRPPLKIFCPFLWSAISSISPPCTRLLRCVISCNRAPLMHAAPGLGYQVSHQPRLQPATSARGTRGQHQRHRVRVTLTLGTDQAKDVARQKALEHCTNFLRYYILLLHRYLIDSLSNAPRCSKRSRCSRPYFYYIFVS